MQFKPPTKCRQRLSRRHILWHVVPDLWVDNRESLAADSECTSSAGGESLSDPVEKMALDVGMLDRQYRKLTDRQKQAHIVVGVGRQQRPSCPASNAVESSTVAVNHLFVGRDMMNSCTGSGATGRSRSSTSNKSPPSSQGSDVRSSSSSSSAKVSPTSHGDHAVTERPARSPNARQPATVPPTTDTDDERRLSASESTEAGRDVDVTGHPAVQVVDETERLDVVELDSSAEHSASDESASESTKCGYADGSDDVSGETEANEDEVRRSSGLADAVEGCRQVTANNRLRPETIGCRQDSTGHDDCHRMTKSLSGGDLSRAAAAVSRDRRSTPVAGLPASESTSRLFSPFPRQYVNKRRVDNAIRLGLYTVDDTTGPRKTTSGRSARYPHS